MSETKSITGFKFIWFEKQTQSENFAEFVAHFSAKFRIKKTSELIEITKDNIGATVLLKHPFEFEKSDACPFGNDPKDAAFHIYDRPVGGKRSYYMALTLNEFFNQNGSIPTIVIHFGLPSFCVNAWDGTPKEPTKPTKPTEPTE